ncbi:MTHFS [Bugula neritina]|uniref:5-formyltetrahydrofolate cyclo-ligase n=1 Tax=Bugula neritina TaxID=10212 RepID=A0A7J7JC15_BUGNE|nr:MTHFS [Bugula neritina]
MKTLLAQISAESREERSKLISAKVTANDVYKKSQRIAVFLSMKDEVETSSILTAMFKDKKQCFIPRYDMTSRDMDMVKLHSLEDMRNLPRTKWDILQPALNDVTRENAMNTGGLDLILMPGLAFTNTGARLGRGKGYYDTFLNNHKSVLGKCPVTMALAFSEQVLDTLPMDEHDYLIDYIISDQ